MTFNMSTGFNSSPCNFWKPTVEDTIIIVDDWNAIRNDTVGALSRGSAATPAFWPTKTQVQDRTFVWGGAASGTANALAVALSPPITAYVAGLEIRFITGSSPNTGAATLSVNGLAGLAINSGDGTTALQPGELPPNSLVSVAHDGTRFRLLSHQAVGGVSVRDFGAKGDGSTDDTAAIQAALDSLGATGGTVIVPNGMKCMVDSNLIIPMSCHLVGPHSFVGTPGTNGSALYGNMGGALLLNSKKTITVNSGASLRGLLIYRKGMTFPAADSSTFAGTAITVGGDDAAVASCLVMGFNKAIHSNGYQRPKVEYLLHDNINGIEITNCTDIAYISNCHAWPFSNVGVGGSYTNITRTGKAYFLHDLCDWAKATNCFSWGYAVGFHVTSANSVTLLGCGADNAYSAGPLVSGAMGFVIDGTSTDTSLIGCQAAAHDAAGVYVNTTGGLQTKIVDLAVWGGGPNSDGIRVNSGDVAILGGIMRGQNYGVKVQSPSMRVFIDGVRFETIASYPIYASPSSSLVFIGRNDYSNFTAVPTANTVLCQSVPSAASVVLPNSGDTFNITGTTSFGALGHGWAGREVSLIFGGSLTVFSGTGAVTNMRLAGGVNFSAEAGSCLTLRHSGAQWYEAGRSE